MAIKNTVVKRDETVNDKARLTRLEALMRKLLKAVEQHWGIDIDGDGKGGKVRVAMLIVVHMGGLFAYATDTTLWLLRPSITETAPDCYVTSDGTDCTLTVNKLNVTGQATFAGTVKVGSTQTGFTGNITNTLYGVGTNIVYFGNGIVTNVTFH